MLHAIVLFAQQAADKAQEQPDFFEGLLRNPLMLMLLVFMLAYFLLILPMKRQERKQRSELFNKLKKNDKVVTSAGIIGVVYNVKENEDEVTLKLDEGRVRVLKSSIARILSSDESAKDAPAKAGQGA